MKPNPELAPLLAFGAHPDDIEFGCGGIVARETLAGRPAHLVVCTRGESASRGTPRIRAAEAARAARLLGATLEFVVLGGDGRLDPGPAQATRLAAVIRRVRPAFVLAPTLAPNQHPDHPRLGQAVRDAARLARYGGLKSLRRRPAHAIGPLLHYAVTEEAEPAGAVPVLFDVSDPAVMGAWTAAMRAHASQAATRNYVELQLARARVRGLRSGCGHAQALFPGDPLVFGSLGELSRSARRF
ncbi:MAG TPA: PIG-L family deacetylase [Opitutaceae bacterium]